MPKNSTPSALARHPFIANLITWLPDLLPHNPIITYKDYFSESEIAKFHHAKYAARQTTGVDDQTWRDLSMDSYTNMVSKDVSIMGRQMLYSRLRGRLPESKVSANAQRVTVLMEDKPLQIDINQLCQPLRRAEMEIGSLFATRVQVQRPLWSNYLWLFQLAIIVSFGALLFSPWAIISVISMILISGALQLWLHGAVTTWEGKAKSLQLMLGVAAELSSFTQRHHNQASAAFSALSFDPGKIHRALACASPAASIPGVGAYLDWFLSDNIRKYYNSLQAFETHAAALETCFHAVADLEADIAIARHFTAQAQFCAASRTDAPIIELDHATHPLLGAPMPVSVSLNHQSAFISGRNGSGKSTLLRIVGVNLLVGRAFGFCYARQALVSRRPLYTSIRNEDSMEGGESLYTAELVRAKTLLDACAMPGGAICLIDEIFRGTNHVESVSAAASVLVEMAENALIMVSSHNLILAPLLAQRFRPLYIERHEDGKSIRLTDGLLVEPNGIQLLATYGYAPAIQARAVRIADWFNHYLAKPGNYPNLVESNPAPPGKALDTN